MLALERLGKNVSILFLGRSESEDTRGVILSALMVAYLYLTAMILTH